MESLSSKKRVRNSDESVLDSVEAKRILLDILDDSDVCSPSHDLDSFMKTFQDEIINPSPAPAPEVAGKSSEAGDRPELGFLFEASDDELGLPPTETNERVLAESVGLSELWGLDDEFIRYDSFESGFVYDGEDNIINNGEYVALDGLFDYTDVGFGSSELTWRPETLPAQ